jgi:hypothetical protein
MAAKFEARVTAVYFTLDGEIKDKDFENWYQLGGSKFLHEGHVFQSHEVVLFSKLFTGKKVWETLDLAWDFMREGQPAIEAQKAADKIGLDNIRTSKKAFITVDVHRVA